MYYVYRKENQPGSYDANLYFGECKFERHYSKRQLGIAINVFKDDEPSNEHGYELEWSGKRPLAPLCYRLQDMKYVWDTEFMRKCTQAYVVGRLQFGSSLYWLRATNASTVRARFDYCMALAATVGCSTPEVVGMFNCKTRRVGATCKNYLELCRYLDLPTLREMAINDSKSLIRQWFLYDKERFEYETKVTTSDGKIVETYKMVGVIAEKGTLLYDLYHLSLEEVKTRYPVYHKMKANDPKSLYELTEEERWEIIPHWMRDYEMSTKSTHETRKRLGLCKTSYRDCINTFWLVVREKFNILERYSRAVRHLELTPRKAACKRLREDDSTDVISTPNAKRRKTQSLSCQSLTPIRRAKCAEGKLKCWICGYGITTKNKTVFECCDRVSHVLCCRNQPKVVKETAKQCHNVSHYMRRDSRMADYHVKLTESVKRKMTVTERQDEKTKRIKRLLHCTVCDKDILTDKVLFMKHHLKFECTSVPSPTLDEGFSHSELVQRMAALGTVKRITRANATKNKLHTPNTEPSPAVGFLTS